MTMSVRVICLLAGAALFLNGCASTPPANQYRLLALAEPVQSDSEASSGTVRLQPVTVPAALQRPVIVSWEGGARLNSSEFERWADTLESLIQEALLKNLTARVPEINFIRGRLHPGIRAAADLNVEILEMDGLSGREAVLSLRWSLSGKSVPATLHHWEGRLETHGPDVQAYVLAQSRLLGDAAEAIAEIIRVKELN